MSTIGPIFTGFFDQGGFNYIQRIDYDANNNAIYIGWAQAGTANSEARWRIVQNTFNVTNLMVASGFPNGSPSFSFVWDARAALSYS